MLGILSSSAAAKLGERLGLQSQRVETPYGPVVVRHGRLAGRPVVCVARHGEERTAPPHRVNYRGNIWALAEAGCTAVLATNAVGSLDPALRPGTLGIPLQILDFTTRRPRTFHDDELVAVDFTEPYCRRLSQQLAEAAKSVGEEVAAGLVYACMEGPRFETAAEIRMLQMLGADLVGMTAMPEAALAREKGLCYAALCVVTNLAAGIEGHRPSAEEVDEQMQQRWDALARIIEAMAAGYRDDPNCPCHTAAMR